MPTIDYYHAHVYFDATSVEAAEKLCHKAGEKFAVTVGRFHHKPVGPHPCWSCQLAFAPELFGQVLPWLALNRGGLTIFTHPNTGDDYKDHAEHAIWMGEIKPLNLSIFR